jgi:hypothetical protein
MTLAILEVRVALARWWRFRRSFMEAASGGARHLAANSALQLEPA